MNLYLLVGVFAGSTLLIGGAYLKGRFDERGHLQSVQLKEFQELVTQENKTRKQRIESDSKARLTAEKFISQVQRKLADVKNNFADLPMVTVDSSGCADINDNFRMRWNSAEGVGVAGPAAGVFDGTVRDKGLLDARELR